MKNPIITPFSYDTDVLIESDPGEYGFGLDVTDETKYNEEALFSLLTDPFSMIGDVQRELEFEKKKQEKPNTDMFLIEGTQAEKNYITYSNENKLRTNTFQNNMLNVGKLGGLDV